MRFGYALGDEVLWEFAARVAGGFCNDAQFFRWRDPTLLGIIKRYQPLHIVQEEVHQLLETPVMKSLSGARQNAFITLAPSWMVVPAAAPATDIIKKIDSFVNAQIPCELKAEQPQPCQRQS